MPALYERSVLGELVAGVIAAALASRSCWFEFVPLGRHEYRIRVKWEDAEAVDRALAIIVAEPLCVSLWNARPGSPGFDSAKAAGAIAAALRVAGEP